MEALVRDLEDALARWKPSVLAVSYLPSLFSGKDGQRLFEPVLTRLSSLTASYRLVTVITSFGGSWYGDRLLSSRASRMIHIEHPSKKCIRITDNGHVFEYVPVPPGQTRFTDFAGGIAHGQDSSKLSQFA
jgi:hypothetical protein